MTEKEREEREAQIQARTQFVLRKVDMADELMPQIAEYLVTVENARSKALLERIEAYLALEGKKLPAKESK